MNGKVVRWLILSLCLLGLSRTPVQADMRWPTTGWETATPESQGMDSALLADTYESILTDHPSFHSLLVIRHGYLVAEMYRYPYTADRQHDQRSITKSNTATLMGIAIHDGYVSGVDAPLLSFFPNQTIMNVDERKQSITLQDLLTMSSGLDWDENKTFGSMIFSPDWVAWMLNRPVTEEPGTRFNYSSAGSNLLAAVIENATGRALADYAVAELYGPLGIRNFQWDKDPAGHTTGGFGLHMTPRDMAKLGYLYLHHGEWDGAQLVPADWIAAATSPQAPVTAQDNFNYGYQWWLPPDQAPLTYFAAQGYGGQLIYVLPERDLVVVVTAGGADLSKEIFPLVSNAIAAAAVSDEPLPENTHAQARLQAAIDRLQTPQPQPIPELPATASMISGKDYAFAFTPFYSGWRPFSWKTIALTFEEGAAEATFTVRITDDQTEAFPIGLDGVPRVTELPGFGDLALTGSWIAPDSFTFNMQVLGLPEDYTFAAHYVDDEMRLDFSERLSADQHSMIGRLAS